MTICGKKWKFYNANNTYAHRPITTAEQRGSAVALLSQPLTFLTAVTPVQLYSRHHRLLSDATQNKSISSLWSLAEGIPVHTWGSIYASVYAPVPAVFKDKKYAFVASATRQTVFKISKQSSWEVCDYTQHAFKHYYSQSSLMKRFLLGNYRKEQMLSPLVSGKADVYCFSKWKGGPTILLSSPEIERKERSPAENQLWKWQRTKWHVLAYS